MNDENEPPRDTRWKPGQSGNPNGRQHGSRSKVCVALEALAEGEAEEIVRAMIEKAKGGDSQAGRTILERICPPRKGARLSFEWKVSRRLLAGRKRAQVNACSLG